MRGRSMIVSALTVATWAAVAQTTWPDPHPQERHGFWAAAGLGAGSARLNCAGCGGGSQTGLVFHGALGGTLNPHLLLGGELNGWLNTEQNATLTLGDAVATATVYPKASSGFFLKAGAGFAFSNMDLQEGPTTVSVDLGSGLALVAGAGYDVRVGKMISITPAVSYWHGTHGDLDFGTDVATGHWHHNVVDFTLSVTFH